MIAKAKSISHTKASMLYGWNQEKDAKVIFKQHLFGQSPDEFTNEFKITQILNEKCYRNTISFVISPTIEDGQNLTDYQLGIVTKHFVTELNLTDHQAVAFVHNDKTHKHIHLYVNRIHFNGKAYNDSFIGKKAIKAAEKVAQNLNLTTVKQVQAKKLNDAIEIRQQIYNKLHQVKNEFKPQSFDEYILQMRKQNINVLPTINKAGSLQGIRFIYKSINLKGSEVHKSLSLQNIIAEFYDEKTLQIPKSIKINGNDFQIHTAILQSLQRQIALKKKTTLENNTIQKNKLKFR